MSTEKVANAEKPAQDSAPIHHIRITLTSRNVRSLEKVCSDLILEAKKQKLRAKGPVRKYVCQPKFYVSLPVRPLVERVPKLGTDSK
ncbi:unnamed protein product [Brassicogethes aeneus]|uniref:40S ribosomal protein S20 n=1 Tax=Brassicogethes aeneus TaxID=1431903 RepID=A0A9P0AYG4_BRAAE|nr:unnamed protein product [Brassicogethes aeneus]